MNIQYKFIGWCHEEGHDKVWGVICLGSSGASANYTQEPVAVFWGRRGKKLQFQIKSDNSDLYKLIHRKRKNYQQIMSTRLAEVYPEFEQDLEATAVWAMLTA